jgi:hypothetical protein
MFRNHSPTRFLAAAPHHANTQLREGARCRKRHERSGRSASSAGRQRTEREFAAQTGLKGSTLTYWSWKLRADAAIVTDGEVSEGGAPSRKARRGKKNAPRFVEISAASITRSTTAIELVLGRGICVRVPPGFDEVTLVR